MKRFNLSGAILVTLLLGACATSRCDSSDREDVQITRGEVAPSGRLIICPLNCQGDPINTDSDNGCLRGDYGMMVFFDKWADPPTPPRFELYIQASKTIIKTTSLKRFEQEITKMPAGATLEWYNTCTVGTYAGIDAAIIDDFKKFCKRRGIELMGDTAETHFPGHIICTCP